MHLFASTSFEKDVAVSNSWVARTSSAFKPFKTHHQVSGHIAELVRQLRRNWEE